LAVVILLSSYKCIIVDILTSAWSIRPPSLTTTNKCRIGIVDMSNVFAAKVSDELELDKTIVLGMTV